jgi:hypothetical protein
MAHRLYRMGSSKDLVWVSDDGPGYWTNSNKPLLRVPFDPEADDHDIRSAQAFLAWCDKMKMPYEELTPTPEEHDGQAG